MLNYNCSFFIFLFLVSFFLCLFLLFCVYQLFCMKSIVSYFRFQICFLYLISFVCLLFLSLQFDSCATLEPPDTAPVNGIGVREERTKKLPQAAGTGMLLLTSGGDFSSILRGN